MKKILLFASALAGLFFASCQRENLEPMAGGAVTFTVTTPGDLDTRATTIANGENVNEVHWAVYKTYEEPNSLENGTKPLAQGFVPMSNKTATLELDLLQDQDYTILFWAQVAGAGHYSVGDLREISVNYDEVDMDGETVNAIAANDESRAAFFLRYDFNTSSQQNYDVTLVRPFAQINLGTTLASLKPVQQGQTQGYEIKVEKSEMTVKGIASSFNLVTGEGKDEAVDFTFTATDTPAKASEQLFVNGSEYHYVGMNYLVIPILDKTVEVSYEITTDKGNITNTISNVPVKENYRTNILGNLLTSKTDFEIVVDADFETNDYVVEGETSFISVSSAEELVKVFDEIADGESECSNIILGADIDLANYALTRSEESNWTPIGTPENPFTGTFNGNGYTIKNLKLVESEAKEGKAYIGFFGYAKDATIKNVTFENVYINIPCLDLDHSQGHIGAVAGSLEGTSTIENVTVKGDIQIYATQDANGASRVAVVAGGNSYGNVTMKNVHVIANDGSYLTANNNTGALAGQLQGKMYFENCSSNIDVTVNKFFAGGLVGIAAGDSEFVDCHTTGNVSVVAGREGRHNDEYRVGGIAGGWADNTTTPCVLTNCSYSGSVSGKNADGAVAEPLDYMGYVGRGYTLSNRAGSKVIIDGVEFVQMYNDQYGIYAVNGVDNPTIVATAKELNAALSASEVTNIVLVNGEFGTIVAKSNKTIVGTENAKVDCINLNGAENVTIKNINFDAATAQLGYDGVGTAKQYANIMTGDTSKPIIGARNIVIDGCTFTGKFEKGGAAIEFTDQKRSSGGSGNITIKNCVFDTEGGYYDIYGYYCGAGNNGFGDFVIENNTFKSELVALPVYLGKYASSTPVQVLGNTFETVSSLEVAVYVQDHSNYGVSVNAENNTFAK